MECSCKTKIQHRTKEIETGRACMSEPRAWATSRAGRMCRLLLPVKPASFLLPFLGFWLSFQLLRALILPVVNRLSDFVF